MTRSPRHRRSHPVARLGRVVSIGAAMLAGVGASGQDAGVAWTAGVLSGAARSVEVRWVDQDGVVWVGLDDIERTVPFADGAFFLADDLGTQGGRTEWPDPAAFGALTDAGAVLADLVDGQRLLGLLGASDDPDAVRLRLGAVCELDIPLERLRRLVPRPTLADLGGAPPGTPGAGDTGADDVVTLENGDRVAGFVVAFGPETGVEIEDASGTVRLPWNRVRSVAFANPPEEPRGLWIDLKDGRTVAAAGILPGRRELRSIVVDPIDNGGAPGGLLPLTIREIAAIVPDRSRAVALAALEPAAVSLPASRRWSPGIERGDPARWPGRLSPVELPGPMRVSYELPEGATAFGAVVRPGVPASAWASATVRIGHEDASDRGPVWAHELTITGDSEPVPVRLALPLGATRLVVEVAESERGAVDDRVRLERAVVLIGER